MEYAIFPGWITMAETMEMVKAAGVGVGKPTVFYHLVSDSIHGHKISIGKLKFWLIYKPSLERYIAAVNQGAVQGRRSNILEDGKSWKWREMREAGQVVDPPKPKL